MRPLVLHVWLDADSLIVSLQADTAGGAISIDGATARETRAPAGSCATCGETRCFRHETKPSTRTGRTAFVVDEFWPEHDAYLATLRRPDDILCLPLDGRRWGLPQYGWQTQGYAGVAGAPIAALRRAVESRRAGQQGAARQIIQLRAAERLSTSLARHLDVTTTRLCVAQTLLPFLWRRGELGGRRFTVLMTRLPMRVLHARLDAAYAVHPSRSTLDDFRAAEDLVAAEEEALAAADALVTPHRDIAELFGERAILLDWHRPDRARVTPSRARRIAFPGPTIARKGAYELREALRGLDVELMPLGSDLEGNTFWNGVRLRAPHAGWLSDVAAVVQPALVEDRPRRLLAALHAGVPVIATRACGIAPQDGLTLVPVGDVPALADAIRALLG
jgi:hypothetical protein